MDLTLTMTKDVDLENYYEKEKEEDFLEVKDPLGHLILDLEDSSYLELFIVLETSPGRRLVTLAFNHLDPPGYLLFLMDNRPT